jgi:hypothetical protein
VGLDRIFDLIPVLYFDQRTFSCILIGKEARCTHAHGWSSSARFCSCSCSPAPSAAHQILPRKPWQPGWPRP